jgi:hypothetical protein
VHDERELYCLRNRDFWGVFEGVLIRSGFHCFLFEELYVAGLTKPRQRRVRLLCQLFLKTYDIIDINIEIYCIK